MTWTYGVNPTGSNLDAVRLMAGDTDITDQLLQDEEVTYFIAQSANIYFAAWKACYAIASKFARQANKAVGQLRLDMAAVAKQYRDTGDSWKEQALSSAMVYAGGVSIIDKQGNEGNADRVPPVFTRDIFRNPGSVIPTEHSGDLISFNPPIPSNP